MRSAALLLLSSFVAGPTAAQPVTFVLDPDSTFVHFEIVHFNTSTIRGRFGPVSGTVMLDRSAHRGELRLRLPTASVSTGVPVFDARIRQPDLLACEAFPEAYFVATRFSFKGDEPVELRGEFTLRGVSQPLSLRALHYACRNEDTVEVCGGDFEAEFKRSEFGATFGLPFVADRVRLRVQVQGRH